jgi:hypothetical protein
VLVVVLRELFEDQALELCFFGVSEERHEAILLFGWIPAAQDDVPVGIHRRRLLAT